MKITIDKPHRDRPFTITDFDTDGRVIHRKLPADELTKWLEAHFETDLECSDCKEKEDRIAGLEDRESELKTTIDRLRQELKAALSNHTV